MTDARIPDHCAWAARGHWSRAYDAAEAEIAILRAELEALKDERDTARAETAMAFEVAAKVSKDAAMPGVKASLRGRLTGTRPASSRPVAISALRIAAAIRALTPANAKAALAARDKATRKQALREAASLPPYDWDGDPASTFENYVFVKRDNIIVLMGK